MGKTKISTGQYRGRTIHFLDQAGVRPTSQRMRITLFNWLGQNLSGWKCLDLFAGSGALGFEAISRGAYVDMVDHSIQVCKVIKTQGQMLGCQDRFRVYHGDSIKLWEKFHKSTYDLVFLDPPFNNKKYSVLCYNVFEEVADHTYVSWEYSAHSPIDISHISYAYMRETRCGDAQLTLIKKGIIHSE